MAVTRIITHIPNGKLAFVIAAINVDNGKVIDQALEGAETTIVAEFPLNEPEPELPAESTQEFGWLKVARQELGVKEVDGSGNNPRIQAYHATTTVGSRSDSVPWCSSFVNFCVEQSGLAGTKSALARSWTSWGRDTPSLIPGCIVVLERGKPPGGHVGFYVGMDGKYVRLLGGNQSDSVSVAGFDPAQIIARRIAA